MFRVAFALLPEAVPTRTILSVSMASVFLNMLLVINPLAVAIAIPEIASVEIDSRRNDFKSLFSPPSPPPDAPNDSGDNSLPRSIIVDIVITTSTSSSYL